MQTSVSDGLNRESSIQEILYQGQRKTKKEEGSANVWNQDQSVMDINDTKDSIAFRGAGRKKGLRERRGEELRPIAAKKAMIKLLSAHLWPVKLKPAPFKCWNIARSLTVFTLSVHFSWVRVFLGSSHTKKRKKLFGCKRAMEDSQHAESGHSNHVCREIPPSKAERPLD